MICRNLDRRKEFITKRRRNPLLLRFD